MIEKTRSVFRASLLRIRPTVACTADRAVELVDTKMGDVSLRITNFGGCLWIGVPRGQTPGLCSRLQTCVLSRPGMYGRVLFTRLFNT